MKRILSIMLAWLFGIALSVGSVNAASSDCLNVKFDNWDSVCLGITKSGTRNFKVSIDKNNLSKTATLLCNLTILDSEGRMYPLNACQWSFTYTSSSTQAVLLSVTYIDNKSDVYYNWLSTSINFKNWAWGSSNKTINSWEWTNNWKSSSKTSDDIELSTNRKSPSTSQYVNLTITTDKKYTGKLYLTAKYRNSTSSSRTTISNTSSSYFSNYSTEWSNGYYKMTSSDKGSVTLSNLVKFKKNGYYRVYVRDADWNESYIQFNVWESSSYNDDLKVSVSPSSPDTYEWVKLTLETDDDYTGRINFSKFQYRSSSSSSWSDISRTSSTYVSDYSTAWSNWYYKMTSSDDGEATLKNLIKFKKSGYYRIYIEDVNWNESYVQISVDTSSSSSSSDEIELSTNRKSPTTSQYVSLTIETDDDYTGKLSLSAKYRSSSSSSRSSISNTSSTYFTDYSDEWDDGYYRMKSSDDGEVTLTNLVKFRKNWYYRIYVRDTDWNESYIQFNVGDVDADDDEDNSKVSWFSSSELEKIKTVYKNWNSMIAEMQRKYPSLKRDTFWLKLSDNLYDDLKDVVDNKKVRDFEDYDDFQDAFDDWYNYTMRNI